MAWSELAEAEDAIRADVFDSAFFSANVEDCRLLADMRDFLAASADAEAGKTREAFVKTFQERLGGDITSTGGKITDISSTRRLELIFDTQTARLAGRLRMASVLAGASVAPYAELYRAEPRREPRDWPARWRACGGELYNGRMIAPIASDIWLRISAFGDPYPPFDFNSGMSVRSILSAEAEALGIKGTAATPPVDTTVEAQKEMVAAPTVDVADVRGMDDDSAKTLSEAVSTLGVVALLGGVLVRVGKSALSTGSEAHSVAVSATTAARVLSGQRIKAWTFSRALSAEECAVAAATVATPSSISARGTVADVRRTPNTGAQSILVRANLKEGVGDVFSVSLEGIAVA